MSGSTMRGKRERSKESAGEEEEEEEERKKRGRTDGQGQNYPGPALTGTHKKTGIQKKTRFIPKCIAQVSPDDFASSQNERSFSQCALRDKREGKRQEGRPDPMKRVCAHKITNKILMLTMKSKVQQLGIPVHWVPPPWSRVRDSKNCIKEIDQQCNALSKVPYNLNNVLRMELESRFDPSLHYLVGALRTFMLWEIVRKPRIPKECLTEEDVVARLVEVFGLLSTPQPVDDVLKEVAEKCAVAFQMLEAEAAVLEEILCGEMCCSISDVGRGPVFDEVVRNELIRKLNKRYSA